MTARQMFEFALIEANKVQAPSLILEDYNYFINKSIGQTINKVYNLYDINQQKTDDLRVLKSSAVLIPHLSDDPLISTSAMLSNTYEVDLPDDYLHILNCVVEYTPIAGKCYTTSDRLQFGAKRLTADMFPQIINNFYMRPKYKNPYYFINNVTQDNNLPTTDSQVQIDDTVDRQASTRYGNDSKVRLEIRYGKDDSTYALSKVYVDYLRSPQHVKLTQEQLDEIDDNSQILEFPDYVCQEILNELNKLLFENASDPRLQTNIPINQTIGSGQ